MKLNGREIADSYYSNPKISYIYMSSSMSYLEAEHFVSCEHLFESFLNEHRFNQRLVSAYTHEKDSVKFRRASKSGCNWNKVLTEFADSDVFQVTSLEAPDANNLAKESTSLTFFKDEAAKVVSVSGRVVWDDEWVPFNCSPTEWFVDFYRQINLARDYLWGGVSLCHSNVGGAYSHYALNDFDGSWLIKVPLLSEVAKRRFETCVMRSPHWRGEPFNLYWGNIIRCDLFENIEEFLNVCTKAVKISKGSVEMHDKKFICLFLSLNIKDSLDPSPSYARAYKIIYSYLMDQKLLHPGLSRLALPA